MKSESNFLAKLSDTWLVAILCIVVPGMFSTGFYMGTQQSDKESIEMQAENREMKDSLSTYRATILQQATTTKVSSKNQ